MSRPSSAIINFPTGHQAFGVHALRDTPIHQIVSALDLPRPRALLLLNGGTSELAPDLYRLLGLAIQDGVARISAEEQLTLVTGGTTMGVFELLGHGLEKWGRQAPCIGVVVDSLVRWPGTPPAWFPARPAEELAPLEPHHSHFVFVEGSEWGEETKTMAALCAELSVGVPSLMIIANGGNVLRKEVLSSVRQGREVLVIAGSGRFADELAAAARGETQPAGEAVAEIIQNGRITLFDLRQPPATLADLVRQRLRL